MLSLALLTAAPAAAPVVVTDPYWSNVVLSLPLTADLVDLKGHTVVAAGNAAVSGSYLNLDGNGDLLTVTASADFNLGTGDFTWEMVVQFASAPSNQYTHDFGTNHTRVQLGSAVSGFRLFGEAAEIGSGQAWSPSTGTDYYIAFKRSGTTVTAVRGTTQGAATTTLTNSCGTSAQNFGLTGTNLTLFNTASFTTLGINGKARHLRITKGVARDISLVPAMPFPTS